MRFNTATPAVTKVAARMAETGLLVRRRDDRDNRLVRFWLTEAGRALQEPIEVERRLLEDKLTADLTKAEREHLLSALCESGVVEAVPLAALFIGAALRALRGGREAPSTAPRCLLDRDSRSVSSSGTPTESRPNPPGRRAWP